MISRTGITETGHDSEAWVHNQDVATYRSPVLVGRDTEMEQLRALAARAGDGNPTAVVLVGEAGVGKSRLAAETAEELERDGALVLVSHGVELSGGEIPYGGAGELVRDMIRILGTEAVREVLGDHAPALAALHPALGAHAELDRRAITAALLGFVEDVGRERLVCWVLDDLQWLDSATRDLAHYLTRVVRDVRFLLIATVRTGPAGAEEVPDAVLELQGAPASSTVVVRPLDTGAVAAQIAQLGGDVAAADVARITRLSDGLPFFVEQLVASGGGMTGSVRHVVLGGVRDLTDDARTLLRAAAVGEGLLLPEVLRTVSGLDDDPFARALQETRTAGVLRLDRDGEVLRFRHALLREAVEGELLAVERRALHRRWAGALDDFPLGDRGATAWTVERAWHWYAAGDRAHAFGPVLDAALAVRPTEDHVAQATWFGRLAELWPEEQQQVEGMTRDRALSIQQASLVATGHVERARRLLDAERGRTPGDALRELWLDLVVRDLDDMMNQRVDGRMYVERADELLAELSSSGADFKARQILHGLLHEWELDRPDLYVPICEQLIRSSLDADDWETWHLAQRHLGWWDREHGDTAAQVRRARESVEVLSTRMPSLRMEAEWDLAWSLVANGQYRAAVEAAQTALAKVPEPRTVLRMWVGVLSARAAAREALGEWDAAQSDATTALGHAPEDVANNRIVGVLASISAARGERDRSVRLLEQMLPPRDESAPDASAQIVPGLRVRVTIASTANDPQAAAEALDELAGLTKPESALHDVDTVVVRASRLVERAAPSQGLVTALSDMCGRVLVAGSAAVATGAAEVGQQLARASDEDSGSEWSTVAESWAALERPYDVAWCRLFEAECHLRDDDRPSAATALAHAMEIATNLRAQPLIDRVQGLARRGRVGLTGSAADPVAGLTEREIDVLRCLARGRTNAQIGDELFMSPKTASVHVSRILTKLGAANRTEAAAAAHRLGLA